MANYLGAIVDPKKLKLPVNSYAAAAQQGNTTYIDQNGAKKQGVYQASPQARGGGDIDWAEKINNGIANGASYQQIQQWNNNRNDKIQQNQGVYGKYQNDSVNSAALNYINSGRQQEEIQRINDFYAQQAAQEEAAKRAQVEMAVGRLGDQKVQVGQSYEDMFRQLYTDRRMAEKNLPQQMAAMGYTGGLTESSALGLATNYATALQKGEQGKIGNLSEIDRAIEDTRHSGNIAIAEQAAKLAQEKFNAYSDLIARQQEEQRLEKQYGYAAEQDKIAQSQWQKEFDWQREQAEKDDEYRNKTLTLKKQGGSSYGGVSGGGYSAVDAAIQKFNNEDRSNEVVQTLLENGVPLEELQRQGYSGNPTATKPQGDVQTQQPQAGKPSMAEAKVFFAINNEMMGKTQKLNIIEQAYAAGEISAQEAERLLNYIGA
ncbi:MAG: hypothetical protein RR949_05065 [Oscillospiraceae bacterium]